MKQGGAPSAKTGLHLQLTWILSTRADMSRRSEVGSGMGIESTVKKPRWPGRAKRAALALSVLQVIACQAAVSPAVPGARSHANATAASLPLLSEPEQERLDAARELAWSGAPVGVQGAVDVRVVGFNDFHGQLGAGRQVGARSVGGAVTFAAYVLAAIRTFEGRSLLVHAGDLVGASPPLSALLQDEPTIEFINLLGNLQSRGHVWKP
jgi:hypothetical protein